MSVSTAVPAAQASPRHSAGEAAEGGELLAGMVDGVRPGAELLVLLLLGEALRLAGVEPVEQLVLELLDGAIALGRTSPAREHRGAGRRATGARRRRSAS